MQKNLNKTGKPVLFFYEKHIKKIKKKPKRKGVKEEKETAYLTNERGYRGRGRKRVKK